MPMIPRDEPTGPVNPTPPPSPPPAAADLLLGAGAEFEGKLTFRGTVRIDARFKGQIVTNDVLVVGEHARIDAEIDCGTVVIHGEVHGNVRAKSAVELIGTARLVGDVETASLRVDRGARLDGTVSMKVGGEKASGGGDKKPKEPANSPRAETKSA
ncbi:MAG: polymer-forming cytoskeletal protein [Anaeromyxobacteraceae bacterium]